MPTAFNVSVFPFCTVGNGFFVCFHIGNDVGIVASIHLQAAIYRRIAMPAFAIRTQPNSALSENGWHMAGNDIKGIVVLGEGFHFIAVV